MGPLLQLVKTGYTKPVQRLDGIYSLLIVAKIAAADIKAGIYWLKCGYKNSFGLVKIFLLSVISRSTILLDVYLFLIFFVISFSHFLCTEETVSKEKIWSLIAQNEPSVVPASMVGKSFDNNLFV